MPTYGMNFEPNFFTKYENYISRTPLHLKGGSYNTKSIPNQSYVRLCYSLVAFIIFTGFVSSLASGLYHTKQMETDKGLNFGMVASQVAFSLTIIILAGLVLHFHISHNKPASVEILTGKYSDFENEVENGNMRIGPNVFTIIVLIIVLAFGVMSLLFSADRLRCTLEGSCVLGNFTEQQRTALKI